MTSFSTPFGQSVEEHTAAEELCIGGVNE
jgi:hypothetical protein